MPFSPHQHSPPQGSMHVQMSPELAQAQMLRDKLSHQYDHQRPPMFGEFKPQFSQSTTSMNQPVSTHCGNSRIFLSLRFYMKSILKNLEVVKLPFFQHLRVLNFVD